MSIGAAQSLINAQAPPKTRVRASAAGYSERERADPAPDIASFRKDTFILCLLFAIEVQLIYNDSGI